MRQLQKGLRLALGSVGASDRALLAALAAFRAMGPEEQRCFRDVAYAQVGYTCLGCGGGVGSTHRMGWHPG